MRGRDANLLSRVAKAPLRTIVDAALLRLLASTFLQRGMSVASADPDGHAPDPGPKFARAIAVCLVGFAGRLDDTASTIEKDARSQLVMGMVDRGRPFPLIDCDHRSRFARLAKK